MSGTLAIKLRLFLRPYKNDVGIKISVEKITLKLARLQVGDALRPKAERDVMGRYATLSQHDPSRQRSNDCKATQASSHETAPLPEKPTPCAWNGSHPE